MTFRSGDQIRLVSDPTDIGNLYIDGDFSKGLSMFGREVEYLKANGYNFINGIATKN